MVRGFVLQPTYRVREGRCVVQLYGRLEDGRPFLVEDDRELPYAFVTREDAHTVGREPGIRLEASALHDLEGRPVVRVVADTPERLMGLRRRLEADGLWLLEGDVRFAYRFLMDRGLRGAVAITGEPGEIARPDAPALVHFTNPALEPTDHRPALRTLSIDIETSPDASRVFSFALVGHDVAEVHRVGPEPLPGALAHPDERSLLRACVERIRALDPDVLVGWNVVDFDLRVLDRRSRELGVAFTPGRSEERVRFQSDSTFTRQGRASMPGRMVLDGIALVRDAMRLEDYRLETVARAVLGRGKKIDHDVADPAAEIERLHREDPAALVAYNLEDARLVLDILEHEDLLALTVERSLLSGMQLDRVGASIASFDLAYLPELHEAGFAAPSVQSERKHGPLRGGAVLDSKPGLFRSVAVYDFKSLYPSLIRTFDLDPLAHARADRTPEPIRAPNGAAFAREGGILPRIIERFMERREAARERGDRHADQAIKIMMNSLYGVLGSGACRFFEPDVANAITGFGQQILGWTREAFLESGVDVVYGDTDSVFVMLARDDEDLEDEEARRRALRLRERVESAIAERIAAEHGVRSRLDLKLERIYTRFFMPRLRGGRGGSKKRYAGWTEGALDVVGLESVRRDWPAAARRLQEGMLTRLFTDAPVVPFVGEMVEDLRAGRIDPELVYVKRVRKGALDRYTASTPPHVQAARKAGGTDRGVIRYLIAETGPEPVLPGRPLPGPIDRKHYLEKLLRPIAEAILQEIGESFDDVLGIPRQLDLLSPPSPPGSRSPEDPR
ncbi:MAG: DNA polymerase II [Myxococcota bacterium]